MDFPSPEYFMAEALKMAAKAYDADEVPVGAVIVHNNKIIAKAHNQVETLKDPSAHAEMIAITQAANGLGQKWLHHCAMYVTIEPCSMCAGALVLARIDKLIYGAKDLKAGACGSILNVINNDKLNHSPVLIDGVLETECAQLMTAFFEAKRNKQSA